MLWGPRLEEEGRGAWRRRGREGGREAIALCVCVRSLNDGHKWGSVRRKTNGQPASLIFASAEGFANDRIWQRSAKGRRGTSQQVKRCDVGRKNIVESSSRLFLASSPLRTSGGVGGIERGEESSSPKTRERARDANVLLCVLYIVILQYIASDLNPEIHGLNLSSPASN